MKKIFKKIIVYIITQEAKLVLKKYKPKIIAITGSVGKTSTKDAIFTVLSKFRNVRKSEKSFNSEIGLPLTILGLPNGWDNVFSWIENIFYGFLLLIRKSPYPDFLVLEVGIGKPGDIKKNVAPWLNPDVVAITCFPEKPVHIEFFKSREDIIEEKSALAYGLKQDGLLILNHDDERVYSLHGKVSRKTISYGFNKDATFKATYPSYSYEKDSDIDLPTGINFKLEYEGNTFPVNLPYVLGFHNIGSSLIAIACANYFECDLLQSINVASEYKTPPGRLSLIKGVKNSILIDDTYNSSPVALSSAIDLLKELKGKRKIAVIGDMLELGKYTEEEHREAGKNLMKIADIVVTVGIRSRYIKDEMLENNYPKDKIYSFNHSKEAGEFLLGFINKGDVVLLKASQGIRLEKAVEMIMLDKENRDSLLCRQDKEWRAK